MKTIIALFTIVIMLSGCAIFKGSEKEKHSNLQISHSGSQTEIKDVDTSKSVTTEKWKFYFPSPAIPPGDLKTFVPGLDSTAPSQPVGNNKDQMSSMQQKYNQLLGAFNYGTAEMERVIKENKGKSSFTSTRDTVFLEKKEENLNIKQDPLIPTWIWVALGLYLFFDLRKKNS